MKKGILALILAVLFLASACAPQAPSVQEDPKPEVQTPVEDPVPPVQSDPVDTATVQKALVGEWSYTAGAVQTDLTFTAEGFEVTTTVGGVSSHSGGTYEVSEGVVLLHYDHGGEKSISYHYKDGKLTLGQIQ